MLDRWKPLVQDLLSLRHHDVPLGCQFCPDDSRCLELPCSWSSCMPRKSLLLPQPRRHHHYRSLQVQHMGKLLRSLPRSNQVWSTSYYHHGHHRCNRLEQRQSHVPEWRLSYRCPLDLPDGLLLHQLLSHWLRWKAKRRALSSSLSLRASFRVTCKHISSHAFSNLTPFRS